MMPEEKPSERLQAHYVEAIKKLIAEAKSVRDMAFPEGMVVSSRVTGRSGIVTYPKYKDLRADAVGMVVNIEGETGVEEVENLRVPDQVPAWITQYKLSSERQNRQLPDCVIETMQISTYEGLTPGLSGKEVHEIKSFANASHSEMRTNSTGGLELSIDGKQIKRGDWLIRLKTGELLIMRHESFESMFPVNKE